MSRKRDPFVESWVLVTGASSGIGAEFARELAQRGARLVLVARSLERLDALASELKASTGSEVHTLSHDLSLPGSAQSLCERVDALGLFVEHLINNAGAGDFGGFFEIPLERQLGVLRLNLEAPLALIHHFVPKMIDRGTGGLLSVASLLAYHPAPWMATYGASKAGLLSALLAIGQELRGSALRATVLCPGPVPTGFQGAAGVAIHSFQKLAERDARGVAREALDGYCEGKEVVIPGALNQAVSVGTRLIPETWAAFGAGFFMKLRGAPSEPGKS